MTSYTLLSCIDSKVEHATKFYGRFSLGPFAPGQALTVANALRRSLLSQLPGVAITLLEVQGATNEYEMLNGVRESILDIILNLKQIVLTSDYEIGLVGPQVGFLNVQGPGVIRSNDLKLPSFIYAVDPNQYVATLSNNGRLNMKFLICCGKNYITYNPNESQYSKWLSLFKKAKPSRHFRILKNSFKNRENQKLSWLVFSEKKKETFLGKKKLFLEQNAFIDPVLTQKVSLLSFAKIKKTKEKTRFYKQWLKQRHFFKNQGKQGQPQKSKAELKNQQKIKKTFVTKQDFHEMKNTQKKQMSSFLFDQIQNRAFIKKKALALQGLLKPETSNTRGYFPVDATFMPVIRVNYLVESTDQGDFKLPKERILLEVWTNGSLHPRHAIHKAAKDLIQLFLPLQKMRTTWFQNALVAKNEKQKTTPFELSQVAAFQEKTKTSPDFKNALVTKMDRQLFHLDIGNLELTARPYSCLKKAKIHTIQDLISYSKQDLLSIKNFGQRSLNQVEKALQQIRLKLK
uniref:RNA polymerase alpha subunit n=1 Tax=Gayralia brasiliensis TaxID=1286870 RepID=UPI002411315C|nr:RNA polymerase alpha subunit [Gayralia brasiliensis]YP_010733781.1 RNA polymerase alpha subunit [Monostroma nitidum]WEG92978.1 RNA polymerase alpha subunit [Gayralia brasiliensis]WEG93052.1 RNA polymerase alpha subunit [Monostroma nitidum]